MINKLKDLRFNNSGIIFVEDIPRVTEILSSMLHEDTLMYWANSLGFKRMRYSDTMKEAADIGTYVHETAEKILANKLCEDINNIYNMDRRIYNCITAFMIWYNQVKSKLEVLSMEVPLIDPYNKFRGTYDLLARINGKIYLVDFKTSSHIGYRYFLQLAAYRYMIYTNLGIEIDGCLILQLSKKDGAFREYLLDFSDENHLRFINECQETFFSIVYAYHHRRYIENAYKEVFKKRG